ncbi:MAG: cytochrome C biogenesis protein [Chitinophagaceae bacterium]
MFQDSAISVVGKFSESGQAVQINSSLFNGKKVKVYEGKTVWTTIIQISGEIPAQLQGTLNYSYGRGEEFYTGSFPFAVQLAGGVSAQSRIIIPTIDIKNPVADCGDDPTGDKSLMGIFILGLLGGFIALLTPCVFPMIPLTVSFFTRQDQSKVKGIRNAIIYGLSIFLIYVLLSLPFYTFHASPQVLNNISTNVYTNLAFFVVFLVFAISFFGYFEITLPAGLANKASSKSGITNLGGIFFMAFTLAIVSFSCTGPILGTLLVGALSSSGGPLELSFGMGGFGLGLALPFAVFSIFPSWLKNIPKSGGWLNTVKIVLGFIELALAIKFLANADNVKQWGLLKREVFIVIWVVIGFAIVLYLLGVLKMGKFVLSKKFSKPRIGFIILFLLITLYLIPGVTNTKWAKLSLISGFPPPVCYSIYEKPVNCDEPLVDYEQAIQLAKKENKPVLIDFTGWACVNCRRMEEHVWTKPKVQQLMREEFILVSLYVDEKRKLPPSQRMVYKTKNGEEMLIVTVGDKWTAFQIENFNATSQPQYAIVSPDEKLLARTKFYTPSSEEFSGWLQCGLKAFKKIR